MGDNQRVAFVNHIQDLPALVQKLQLLLYSGATIENNEDLPQLLSSISRLLEGSEEHHLEKEAFSPTVFSETHLLALKSQIMAYKLITKNQEIPLELQKDILSPLDDEYPLTKNNWSITNQSSSNPSALRNTNKILVKMGNDIESQMKVLETISLLPTLTADSLYEEEQTEIRDKLSYAFGNLTVPPDRPRKLDSFSGLFNSHLEEQHEYQEYYKSSGLSKYNDEFLACQRKKGDQRKRMTSLVLQFHFDFISERARTRKFNTLESAMSKNMGVYQKKKDRLIQIQVQADDYLRSFGSIEGSQKVNDYYDRIHYLKEKVCQPTLVTGDQLKPYQLKGLECMISLYNNQVNGVLEAEMSLGNIFQTIILISYLVETKKSNKPFLIIVSPKAISNWKTEFDRLAPNIKKIVYNGSPSKRKNNATEINNKESGYKVLLTTNGIIHVEKHTLSLIKWLYIIVDEVHHISSINTKTRDCLQKDYTSDYRLVLTITSLFQTNLSELWILLNFLLPTLFGSFEYFEEWFRTPLINNARGYHIKLTKQEEAPIIQKFCTLLGPFWVKIMNGDTKALLASKTQEKLYIARKRKIEMMQERVDKKSKK
ncbi:unnamed protein product [Rhizopus stolonifer]